MEYNLTICDETIPVNLDIEEESKVFVSIRDNHYLVEFSRINDHLINMTVDGRRVNAYISETSEGKEIFINGRSYAVVDADVLEQAGSKKGGGAKTADEITPPMPAVVVSIMVNDGDMVEKGQGIVVVSAMKMETTLFAPYDGCIKSINVQEGDKVMPGEILVDIEKKEEDKERSA